MIYNFLVRVESNFRGAVRPGPAPVAGAQIRFYLDNGHVRFAGPEICKSTLILYKTRSGL